MPETALMPTLRLLQVAVPVPMFAVFDYSVPESFAMPPIGARVSVPFGHKTYVGMVIGHPVDSSLESTRLKPIVQVMDTKPLLPDTVFNLLAWAAHYYHYPLGEVFSVALPTLLRQTDSLDNILTAWRVIAPCPVNPDKLTERQKTLYNLLKSQGNQGLSQPLLLSQNTPASVLSQLTKKGVIEPFELSEHTPQQRLKAKSALLVQHAPLTLNTEQSQAVQAILPHLEKFRGILLEGVTGSGKTEVYLQIMAKVLARGQQVLVLVPEIGLTPQTVGRFATRFKTPIILLHSRMNDAQRLAGWQAAHHGEAFIIIGTRSAIFTPMAHLGLIVLDEEHDLSYKQQESLRYHARDVALKRGQLEGCPVLLGTATPALETLRLAYTDKLLHLRLTERAHHAPPPVLRTIDLRAKKREGGLSIELIKAIEKTISQGEQVLIFLNRRGYAPVLLCESCGWQADCPRCDAHLTVHHLPGTHLECHHCTLKSKLPPACPNCKSVNLMPTGNGTARAEEVLQAYFPMVDVVRVDRDTTSKMGSWDAIYAKAHEPKPLILLGTQMLAKGHHFPYVTLVGIIDADAGFLSSDFRAPERTAQQITQVAGRAGREQAGQVLIQSWQPDNVLLRTLIEQGYHDFALNLLSERQKSALPPFRYAALLRAESPSAELTQQFLQAAVVHLQHDIRSKFIEIWGPVPAPMEKRDAVYRGHVLFLANERPVLHDILRGWWPSLLHIPERKKVRASLDIDPQELA